MMERNHWPRARCGFAFAIKAAFITEHGITICLLVSTQGRPRYRGVDGYVPNPRSVGVIRCGLINTNQYNDVVA